MKKIRDLYKEAQTEQKAMLMTNALVSIYPEIGEEPRANFVSDYLGNKNYYDRYFVNFHGEKMYDLDAWKENATDAEAFAIWLADCDAIVATHLDAWARLYYALSLQYNPIWNVDGSTVKTFSEHETTDSIGERERTDSYGEDQTTDGQRTDTSKTYAVAYDSATEKESGKVEDVTGQKITTRSSHEDTHTDAAAEDVHTSGEHTETEVRSGNIGVTMTQQLLNAEWDFRKKNFFKTIMKTIVEETGLSYE